MRIFLLILALFLAFGCTKLDAAVDDAVKNNDPRFCEDLNKSSDKQTCYQQVSERLDDPKACSGAGNPDACITNYALFKNDAKYCDEASDNAKLSCQAQVGGAQLASAVDELFDDLGSDKLCKKQCVNDGNECRYGCIITQGKEIEKCERIFPDETSIFYDDCEEKARNEFQRCIPNCVYGQEDCVDDCKDS